MCAYACGFFVVVIHSPHTLSTRLSSWQRRNTGWPRPRRTKVTRVKFVRLITSTELLYVSYRNNIVQLFTITLSIIFYITALEFGAVPDQYSISGHCFGTGSMEQARR